MEISKRKDRFAKSKTDLMSSKTKKFLQKMCRKESPSVDMTQYGFMRDSKVYRVKLLIQPLSLQLQKICDKCEPKISAKHPCKRVRLAENQIRSQLEQRNVKKKVYG